MVKWPCLENKWFERARGFETHPHHQLIIKQQRKKMLKPTNTYRMSTENKIRLSKIHDAHLRGAIKRSIIDADLAAAVKPSRDKTSSNKRPSTPAE